MGELKHSEFGEFAITRKIVSGAAVVQIVLLIVLVPPFAATGAAIATL